MENLNSFSDLKDAILRKMQADNLWWSSGEIPADFEQFPRRKYLNAFYPMVKQKEVKRGVILMGPRRVGKTVMLFHTIAQLIKDGVDTQKIVYLSIDTPIYNNIALEQLFELSREALKKVDEDTAGYYVFFDEIQYLKDWEIHLKSLVDTYRNVKFIASGSAAAALKMKSNESGAGRFSDFILPPLTFNEYIDLLGLGHLIVPKTIDWNGHTLDAFDTININLLNTHFINYINYGGYPEIVFSPTIQANPSQYVRHDIVDKVMLRDLPSLYGIHDVQELFRLFIHIAYFSGEEFSYDSLSKSSGMRKDVVKKYITYLEAAFLIKVVNRVDANAKRMQRQTTFKIYLTNPALRCALFSPLVATDQLFGSMVETAIFAQWIPRYDTEVYYANWKEGNKKGEVDIVGLDVARQKPSWAVEVKWSDRYYNETGDLKSLLSFLQNNNLPSAVVTSTSVYATKQLQNVTLQFIPAAVYAYIVGVNTIRRQIGSQTASLLPLQ